MLGDFMLKETQKWEEKSVLISQKQNLLEYVHKNV